MMWQPYQRPGPGVRRPRLERRGGEPQGDPHAARPQGARDGLQRHVVRRVRRRQRQPQVGHRRAAGRAQGIDARVSRVDDVTAAGWVGVGEGAGGGGRRAESG